MRRALGLGRVTLYGDSYGTFLAQSYAFRHPRDAERPGARLGLSGPRRERLVSEPDLDRRAIHGDRLPALDGLLRQRAAAPAAGSSSGFGRGTAGWGRWSTRWRWPATRLRTHTCRIDRAGTALRRGDATPWKVLIAQAKLGYGHLRHFSLPQEDVVSCNDYPLLWSKDASEAKRRAELERKVRTYGNAAQLAPFKPREVALSSETLYQYCLPAPRPSRLYEPPVGPGEKPTTAPVLVVSGELDNVTSAYEGRLVADEFPNSRQYIARGAGHVADLYDGSSPPAVRTRRFLRNVYGPEG